MVPNWCSKEARPRVREHRKGWGIQEEVPEDRQPVALLVSLLHSQRKDRLLQQVEEEELP